ncbi:EAL domain-containing protein [Sphingomonas sp. KR1UV-12]|uniref:EAL domain-containing protein n=1 Tax=Sphingomonas aurea TaxID=3063994 RepID=A0ABT9ENA0_9SPHN|nr:EAL domain-containing protein [Sphingomonas sp. KR1UV-12]MDP1028273.1 EAL domain-containing protein [Sphingomonas sp. KR1UV-12]
MYLRTRTSVEQDRPTLAMLLGITEDRQDATGQSLDHLAQVAAAWPMAAGVQLVAVIAAAIATRGAALTIWLGGLLAIASIATMLLVRAPLFGWPPHRRAQLLAIASAATAAALLPLIWSTADAPPNGIQLGATVMLAGATGLSGLAVHSVRAAILSFGVGLVAAMAVLVSAPLVILEATVLLGALGLATLRLAHLDRAASLALAERADEGRHAVKMMAEFEGQGTGWFWEADRHGRVIYLSAKVADEIAAADATPIGRLLTDIFRMDSAAPGTERTLAFHLSSRTSFSDYSVCAAADREGARWWSISGRPVVDSLGRFQGFIGSGADLTEKRKSEAEITRLALFDGLTGLANRQRMRLSLDKTLAQAAGQHRPASLFLMDLDRFKAVNDTLGHQAGDALLKMVAQRLQRVVGEAGLVGRLGGDEFQVLLPGTDGREGLATLARALIDALSQPYLITGTQVSIGCSIGIAIAPQHGEDAETLIRNADLALYAAKGDGRGVHRFYAEEMLAGAKHRQQLEDDLRTALGAGDFHLCYQPVVGTADARIVGYEALVRWEHPVRGLVSPADFVPVAEECGLIEALGEWVLRTACEEAARWPGSVRVAVNVSPVQFANPQLPGIVASALAHAGLAPDRLELEITEGVFLNDSTATDQMFRALKGLGVRLALDDFGTGYSSLGYLRSAPFDKIKIDQSFVRGIAQPGNRNAAIIKAIVTLAETLGMETTAEGVEVQDEIDLVRELGCSHIQGYVYGRPTRAEHIAGRLDGGELHARPIGFKVSRAPRTRMLRSARIVARGREGDVRIRDISATGAMIDGTKLDARSVGLDLLIELVEDRMIAAQVRWAQGGRAGLHFAEAIDVATVAASSGVRTNRRAG